MIISMPKVLLDKLGNDGAEALAHILNDAETNNQSDLVTRGDFKAGLAETKAEIIKWMFVFWIGQVGTTLAILFVFFKK